MFMNFMEAINHRTFLRKLSREFTLWAVSELSIQLDFIGNGGGVLVRGVKEKRGICLWMNNKCMKIMSLLY